MPDPQVAAFGPYSVSSEPGISVEPKIPAWQQASFLLLHAATAHGLDDEHYSPVHMPPSPPPLPIWLYINDLAMHC